MKNLLLSLLLLAVVAAVAGCFRAKPDTPPPTAGETLSATAAAAVAHLSPLGWAGMLVMAAGGLWLAVARDAGGAMLAAAGAAMICLSVTLIRYPVSALIGSVGGVAAMAALWVLERRGKQAAVQVVNHIAQAVESVPGGREVKGAIAAKGPETESLVRRILAPIKALWVKTPAAAPAEEPENDEEEDEGKEG